MSEYSRRELFQRGGVLAVGLMTPPWLASIAKADMIKQAKGSKVDPDNIIVVCQFTGGNDGLNTIIPFNDPTYLKARPTLAIGKDKALHADENLGFHPAMVGIHKLFKEGKVAVINNVGYPNSNRSHFKSMEIWQSASPEGDLKYGWVGRHFDSLLGAGAVSPVAGLGLSTEKPRALNAAKASLPCFASLADIKNMVGDPDAERLLRDIQGSSAGSGSDVRAIQNANNSALDAMTELQSKLDGFAPKQEYGDSAFGRGFKQIAQLIATSPQTRVIYFSAGGFDTHSRQAENHEKLMQGFSEAVAAFQAELEALGKADKVITLVFSEFGRRVFENGSAGTDHGKAGPMMLIGKPVKGGFYGGTPDLNTLSDGDLAWKIDFRQVYATALDNWMGSESKMVLGESFTPLSLFR